MALHECPFGGAAKADRWAAGWAVPICNPNINYLLMIDKWFVFDVLYDLEVIPHIISLGGEPMPFSYTFNNTSTRINRRLSARYSALLLFILLIAFVFSGQTTVSSQITISRIAFTSYRHDPNGYKRSIYLMSSDGSGVTRLTDDSVPFAENPAWSPDGSKLAFSSFQNTQTNIYTINSDGSSLKQIAIGGTKPTWSPDSTRIAFECYRNVSNICIINADGTGELRITTNSGDELFYNPAWSPDGTRIAFVYEPDSTFPKPSIYVMNVNGSGKALLPTGGLALAPAWSSDSLRIAFTKLVGPEGSLGSSIYTINVDGTGLTRLSTNDSNFDGGPSWSPDSVKILFSSSRDGNPEIYVMNSNGSEQTRLTNNPANDFQPAWSPQLLDPNGDEDGDGLLNGWEQRGIDENSDGIIDLNLPALGAKVDQKDIFVEIDYMTGQKPLPEALNDVVRVFRQSPVDSPKGINLHLMVDEEIPLVQNIRFASNTSGIQDSFNDLKLGGGNATFPGNNDITCGTGPYDAHFGTIEDRLNRSNCNNILTAKRRVFRYAIFGHSIIENPKTSGVSEEPGNDLLITLGNWSAYGISVVGGRRVAEASTFMHELGHTLGLKHGGDQGDEFQANDDRFNCKPNYFSIMSYIYQFPIFDPTRPLNYSHEKLADLNETSLNETKVFTSNEARYVIYNSTNFFMSRTNETIDWNSDGDKSDTNAQVDINYIEKYCPLSPNQILLTGFDDWGNLQFNVNRNDGYYADGAPAIIPLDLTSEQAIVLAESIDFDKDGKSNATDNCPAVANPDQSDQNKDGIGDACTSKSTYLPFIRH